DIECSTIDTELNLKGDPGILLIDVEGAELKVIKGGMNFVQDCEPLIIFEFNDLTKKYFSMEELKEVLGEKYSIFRLRKDSMLDVDFSDTWNCVAIPAKSVYDNICKKHNLYI
ncbi:MAG: FkbM family methyltransferase, partial [Candidatus Heimdallarchaeota archaeon]|nr:FkbM family methyltransferase [Candidatus Heimdallarchaeota archaeon]